MSRAPFAWALGSLFALVLAGCAPTVAAQPAAGANDPACAAVTVRLPATLGELPKRETNAQATGAWGDPVEVLLTCGVRVPLSSTLRCLRVGGIDWLVDDAKAPSYVFTAFGRTPAVDVVIRPQRITAETALLGVSEAVAQTTPNGRRCQSGAPGMG